MTDEPTARFRKLGVPINDLTWQAIRFAQELEHPAVFHHSVRSYLYGRAAGERQGVYADRDYDDELLFLGCVLHDVGLSEPGDRDHPFEIDGADLAAEFLSDQGVVEDRIDVVWDAIAMHTSPLAEHKGPEIALVSLGAGYDLKPIDQIPLPDGYAERVHAAFPRMHSGLVLRDQIVEQALRNPAKATPFTLTAELVRQRTGQPRPTWQQMLAEPPSWNDADGYASPPAPAGAIQQPPPAEGWVQQ